MLEKDLNKYLGRLVERSHLQEKEVIELIAQKKETFPQILKLEALMRIAKEFDIDISDSIEYYEYFFPNSVDLMFEYLLDLPKFLFISYSTLESSDINEIIIQKLFSEKIYKLKIIEKKNNEKLVYFYDFWESEGELGILNLTLEKVDFNNVKLTIQNQIIDSKSLRWQEENEYKVNSMPPGYDLSVNPLLAPYQYNFLGTSLDNVLKRQDMHRIFVKCRNKKVLVQNYSGLSTKGLILYLNDLDISKIKDDIEGFEYLADLTHLLLNNNKISEITDLGNLRNLRNLNLNNNKIRQISGLENLESLKYLNLSNNDIEWINGLENLKNLEELHLNGNKIHEIEGLENLTNLKKLILDRNQISEIRGLANLEKLEHLQIKDNLIPEELIDELGGYAKSIFNTSRTKNLEYVRYPQRFVRYCKKPELERKDMIQRLEINGEIMVKKVQEILETSSKIRLSMLRSALELDKGTFDRNIFKWAKNFGYKITGDFLIKEETELETPVNEVNDWEVLYCPDCGTKISNDNQKICEVCGKEL